MSNLGNLLQNGAQVLKLEDELAALQALAKLAERWGDLTFAQTTFASLTDFLSRLDDEIDKPDVKAAFKAVGLEKTLQDLKAERKKISELMEKAGVTNAPSLLSPLASFSGEDRPRGPVKWSLIDQKSSPIAASSSGNLSYGFDLGGKLELAMDAGEDWPYASDGDFGPLLRMGVDGSITSKGNFKAPFSFGSAKGSAGAEGSTKIDFYFEPSDQSQVLVGAVATRILSIPNPFDVDAIQRAFNSRTDFLGFDIVKDGAITAALEIGLGKGVEIANIGKVGVELEMKATLLRERKFQISLRRLGPANTDNPDMQLVVSGHKKSEDSRSLGIQVVLEFNKLTEFLHAQLKPLVNEWDTALKKITPYLTPGTYLQQQAKTQLGNVVKKLVSDPQLEAAIFLDLQLLLGTSNAKTTAVGDFLTDQVVGTLNGQVSALLGDAKGEATELLDGLKKRLPFLSELLKRTGKDQVVTAELEKLTKKLSTEFDKKIKSVTATQTERQKIAKTLGKVGADANAIVSSANDALSEVRKFIKDFDKTVKGALKSLTEAANQKATLSYTYSVMKSDKSTYELNVTMPADTSQEDYRALISGDFAEIKRLIMESGTLSFGKGTNLHRVVEHQRKYAGEIVAFGLTADFSTVFSGKAEIQVDHHGIVSVSSKATANKISTTLIGKEKTEASFFDVISMARAKEAEQENTEGKPYLRTTDLGLSLRRIDKEKGLKVNELEKLLEDLTKFELVSAEGADEAHQTVMSWFGAGSRRSIPVIIDVVLPLTNAQVKNIINLGNPDLGDWDGKRARTVEIAVNAILDILRRDKPKSAWRIDEEFGEGLLVAENMLHSRGTAAQLMFGLAQRGWSPSSFERLATRRLPDLAPAGRKLYERVRDSWRLVEMTEELYRVYTGIPIAATSTQKWDIHRFAEAQRSIADAAEPWLATGQWLFGAGTDGIDERMAAHFLALGGMAGMDGAQIEQAITLKIQNTDDIGKSVVVR